MNSHTVKRVISAMLILCTMLSTMSLPVFAAGTWTPSDSTRIYVANDHLSGMTDAQLKELDSQVYLFALEYAEKLGLSTPKVVYGLAKNAGSTDVVLVVNSTASVSRQGYSISVSSTKVTVTASDIDGIFYGWRAIIKQMLADGAVSAVTNDAPDVLERTVTLDNGRKYFSVDWIKELIREMSWANMNALVLHFSEEMGMGIESKQFPWLAGRDGDLCVTGTVTLTEEDQKYLTQEEVKEIVEYANLYNIEIIPSLDTPGHMNYIVKLFEEKADKGSFTFYTDYKNKTGLVPVPKGADIHNYYNYKGTTTSVVPGSGNPNYSRGIDISNDLAVQFTHALINEYAQLFADLGCTKIDIGGDELLGWGTRATTAVSSWQQLDHWKAEAINVTGNSSAVAYDLFLYYMNNLNDLVRGLGYTSVRMWNDDCLRTSDTGWTGVVTLDTDIDVWYWNIEANNETNTVWTYLNNGYQVYNLVSDYNYYVLHPDFNVSRWVDATAENIYEKWTPYNFVNSTTAVGNANVLGGALGIWCDKPTLKTQDEVMTEVLPMIRANAAKSWDATASGYSSFTAYCDKIGNAANVEEGIELYYTWEQLFIDAAAIEAEQAALVAAGATTEQYNEQSYLNYMSIINEADTYYRGSGLVNYTATQRDTMYSTIIAAKGHLFRNDFAHTVYTLIDEYYLTYLPRYEEYALETWSLYSINVQAAERYMAEGYFTEAECEQLCEKLIGYRDALMPESMYAAYRETATLSAGFNTSYIYSGKTAVLTVNTVVSESVHIMPMTIFDKNGNVVYDTVKCTKLPINRRRPTVQSYSVSIRLDVEPGTYTVRIYGVGDTSGLYTANYVECSIEVR